MSERRWEVRIDRLVVDAAAGAPGSSRELERAIADELARRLAEGDPLSVATGARAVGRSRHAVDAAPRPAAGTPAAAASPRGADDGTAADAARAIHSALDT